MRDVLGPGTICGYCTNVHAGVNWQQTRANLERHARRVRDIVCPKEPMGIGLWLSAAAAADVRNDASIEAVHAALSANGLFAYTFNGFPYGDFHEPVVKRRVYSPDWSSQARLSYTCDLAWLLASLVQAGGVDREGSISTLPIGWVDSRHENTRAVEELCCAVVPRFRTLISTLARLESETGICVHVDLEPEPGCVLDRAEDVVTFFERYLLRDCPDEHLVRRHLRVCHDVCHSAVMFEAQDHAFRCYEEAGIAVGKVQISSAVRANARKSVAAEVLAELGERFCEERYLHQTVVRSAGGSTRFFDDLPDALAADTRSAECAEDQEWRVHFHVPIFVERIGHLDTTHDQILPALRAARQAGVRHFEVETYAWDVLPASLARPDVGEGIADELLWLLACAGQESGE